VTWTRYQPILIGGLFIGVLSALPIINVANCCCLWILVGGAIAAHLEQQQKPLAITAGDGALAGLLAGLVGAVVWLIVSTPIDFLVGSLQAKFLQDMLVQARDMPESMRIWTTGIRTGAFTIIQLVIGFFIMIAVGAIFGAIGGALGVAIFGRRQPPVVPPESA
jgi:hypothetical protein